MMGPVRTSAPDDEELAGGLRLEPVDLDACADKRSPALPGTRGFVEPPRRPSRYPQLPLPNPSKRGNGGGPPSLFPAGVSGEAVSGARAAADSRSLHALARRVLLWLRSEGARVERLSGDREATGDGGVFSSGRRDLPLTLARMGSHRHTRV